MKSDSAIITRALTKRYGDLTALDTFDLEVARGEIFGLLGPNGAGKTTLIRILTTLLRPDSGEALVEGLDTSVAGRDIRQLIGVVPQENSLDRYLTARENLELHARLHGMTSASYRNRMAARFPGYLLRGDAAQTRSSPGTGPRT
jgi:ABC-2 type transport system ATP-binding protein